MAIDITCFEDLFQGEDGRGHLLPVCENCLARAAEDGVRLRVECRVQYAGVPSSRQDFLLQVDPSVTTPQRLVRLIIEKCEDSPGPEFHGQLRLNFAPEGHSGNKYQSWTRNVRYRAVAAYVPGAPTPPTPVPDIHSGHLAHDDDDEIDDDETDDDLNDAANLGETGHWGPVTSDGQMRFVPNQGPLPLDARVLTDLVTTLSAQQQTAIGFMFRATAQQQAMFERSMRGLESFALRFGLPDAFSPAPGVTQLPASNDNRGDPSANAQGSGMIPMLLNTVGNLLNANSPGDAAARAGSMAMGNPPPEGAARQAAIRGAGRMVNALARRPAEPAQPAQPAQPLSGAPPMPSPHDDAWDQVETDPHDSVDDMVHDDLDDDLDDDTDLGGDPMSQFGELPPDEVQDLIVGWMRAKPENKSSVMGMLPALQSELMGGD